MKFRKKPVEVEARQLTIQDFDKVLEWCYAEPVLPNELSKVGILIKTLEGNMKASIGDWIVKGVNGEFYPCKPGIFEKTYEPIN